MSTVIKPAVFHRSPSPETVTISEKLADFASAFDLDRVPDDVAELAKLHILDCIGIAFASTTKDYGRRAVTAARELGGVGNSPVIGMPVRLPMRDAAMVNGTLIHGLDFDDTHTTGVMHCSASAVPTMLALGHDRGRTGKEALTAYLMAIEAGTRVAKAARGGFHKVGFHTTTVVGTYACALLAGRLADLTKRQLVCAQGMAGSMASGTREYHADGSWSKRMHPGLSALNGITAAIWAKNGFTGPRTTYEGQYGLYNTIGHNLDVDLEECTSGLGEEWEILDVAFKPYPSCHWTHAYIEAAIRLREEHDLRIDEIESVTALAHNDQMAICVPEEKKRRPHSSYASQFSLHYTIAAALIRERFTLAEIESEAFTDPQILALCDKVNFQVTEETLFPRYFSGTVIIRTTDGRELRHYQKYNLGSEGNPLAASAVKEKFWNNMTMAVSDRRARRVLDAVMNLDRADDLSEFDEAVCFAAD